MIRLDSPVVPRGGNTMRILLASCLVLMLGLGSNLLNTKAEEPKPAEKPGEQPAKVFDDAEFVKMAASGGMHEVELGKMAAEKAKSTEVKKLGQMMVDDHTKAGEALKAVAVAHKLELPAKMMEKHQKMVDKFKELKDEAFDKEYVKHAVMSHEMSVAAYTRAIKEAKNPDLRDFATKTLPTLQSHLKLAKELNEKTN